MSLVFYLKMIGENVVPRTRNMFPKMDRRWRERSGAAEKKWAFCPFLKQTPSGRTSSAVQMSVLLVDVCPKACRPDAFGLHPDALHLDLCRVPTDGPYGCGFKLRPVALSIFFNF